VRIFLFVSRKILFLARKNLFLTRKHRFLGAFATSSVRNASSRWRHCHQGQPQVATKR
jgi:hypothetical protein